MGCDHDRSERQRKKYTHNLSEGEDPLNVAARLTKELRKASGVGADYADFDCPISYPAMKNA